MSSLIKINDAKLKAKVRSLAAASSTSPPELDSAPANPEVELLHREVAGLVQKLIDRDAGIERLKGELERAYKKGEAQGREAGLKAAQDASETRLKRLGLGIDQAVDRLSKDLASLETLSLGVALQGLQKILGDETHYSDLLARSIQVQLRKIDESAVLKIVVSSNDFPDASQLEHFAEQADLRKIRVEALDQLEAGECQIVLMLGALQVGVKQQWDRLRAALEGWAAE